MLFEVIGMIVVVFSLQLFVFSLFVGLNAFFPGRTKVPAS